VLYSNPPETGERKKNNRMSLQDLCSNVIALKLPSFRFEKLIENVTAPLVYKLLLDTFIKHVSGTRHFSTRIAHLLIRWPEQELRISNVITVKDVAAHQLEYFLEVFVHTVEHCTLRKLRVLAFDIDHQKYHYLTTDCASKCVTNAGFNTCSDSCTAEKYHEEKYIIFSRLDLSASSLETLNKTFLTKLTENTKYCYNKKSIQLVACGLNLSIFLNDGYLKVMSEKLNENLRQMRRTHLAIYNAHVYWLSEHLPLFCDITLLCVSSPVNMVGRLESVVGSCHTLTGLNLNRCILATTDLVVLAALSLTYLELHKVTFVNVNAKDIENLLISLSPTVEMLHISQCSLPVNFRPYLHHGLMECRSLISLSIADMDCFEYDNRHDFAQVGMLPQLCVINLGTVPREQKELVQNFNTRASSYRLQKWPRKPLHVNYRCKMLW